MSVRAYIGNPRYPLILLIMSDTDPVPAEPTFSSDLEGLREAVAAQRQARAVAEVDAAYLCAVAERLLKEQQ